MLRLSVGLFVLFMLSASISLGAGEAGMIPVEPDAKDFVIVKKLLATDSRVVRGFLGTPIDGSLESWDYRGTVREYPRTASDGVHYAFNGNDGLHVALNDDAGFNCVVLRGGASTRLYADVDGILPPKDRAPLYDFASSEQFAQVHFDEPVKAWRASFFDARDGAISDVAFYRIERGAFDKSGAEPFTVAAGPGGAPREIELPKPDSQFSSESVRAALEKRYSEGDRRTVLIAPQGEGVPVDVRNYHMIHFMTPPFDAEKGLAAIALEAKIAERDSPCSLTAHVHDPLNPRLDLTAIQFAIAGPGIIRIAFDIPDQVLLKGSRVWLSLEFDRNVRLTGLDGGSPKVWLQFAPREKALSEALAWRKFLLRSYFMLLSEPRPWGQYAKQSREEFFASDRYAAVCPEFFMTIDQCHALAPDDDLVRQYREWVYLNHLESLAELPAPPKPEPGAPEWAWYSRLSWLEARRIAQWWLDNRLVPTGEFGGRLGDDSDMYQQFTDLPFFESDGVGGRLRDAAARLAELADKENLRGGINRNSTDALHAYEEGINHLALMARWFYGDPIYLERCMDSARNMEKLTIVTPDGRRHFRDFESMGWRDVEKPRAPNVDGQAAPLMWHAALQFADYNRSPAALRLVREYADSWLALQKPEEGAIAVEVMSGKIVGREPGRPLYGGYRSQASVFTWLYAMTGEVKYIEPILYYIRKGKLPLPANDFIADIFTLGGLRDLDRDVLANVAPQNTATAVYVHGDTRPLVAATIGDDGRGSVEIDDLMSARRWPDMATKAEPYTDRVFFGVLQQPSIAYLGGYCRRNKLNPTLAASWEGFGTDYAALVLENQPNRLKAAVYNFHNNPMAGRMRVWALEHGRYEVRISLDANGDLKRDRPADPARVMDLARADTIEITLPPKIVTIIEIEPREKLDPIFERADLAVAPREVGLKDDVVSGTVHNIGSKDVDDAIVAVRDEAGREVARQSLGRLAAPLDLVPKRVAFRISLPKKPAKSWRLVLDPERRVPEIFESNNEVALDALPAPNYAKGWN